MVHYSNNDRLERAPRRHGHPGLILTGVALLMLVALAWLWTEQQATDTPLPQTAAAVSHPAVSHPAAPAAAAPLTAKPVDILPAAPVAPATLMPPSDAVAAAGDTRAAR